MGVLVIEKISYRALYVEKVSILTVYLYLMTMYQNFSPTGSVLTVSSAKFVPQLPKKVYFYTATFVTKHSTHIVLSQNLKSSLTVAGSVKNVFSALDAIPRISLTKRTL